MPIVPEARGAVSASAARVRQPPRPGRPPALERLRVETHCLGNGLEILCIERRGLPLLDLRLAVRGGATADTAAAAGCASLTGELLEEGAAGRTGLEIATAIDRLGAFYSARTGRDDTVLSLHTLSSRIEDGLRLLYDLAARPDFPDTEVRRRRELRIAAILQEHDDPALVASHTLANAIYGSDHPYGLPVRGTCATVRPLTRDTLAAFHAARFTASNAFLVAVGDFAAEDVFGMAERVLGTWSSEAGRAVSVPAAPEPRPGIVIVDRPDAPQSELRIGRAGVPRTSPDHPTLVVLNTLLGGAFTSRLNLRLREEKGYTYGARSMFSFRRGPGPFVAGAAVSTDVTADAVADILAEMRRLRDEPAGEQELERVRNYIVLGLPRRLETGAALAAHVAQLHLHGLPPDGLPDWAERVRAVSADDVCRAAQRMLDPASMVIVIAGDRARIEGPLERPGTRPIRIHSPEP